MCTIKINGMYFESYHVYIKINYLYKLNHLRIEQTVFKCPLVEIIRLVSSSVYDRHAVRLIFFRRNPLFGAKGRKDEITG